MAYGRLDVFWPDGLFKTYLLSEANTTIGRSSSSTIPLDTETLSRYHVNITYQNGEVKITDLESANGTFVDGVRLHVNESSILRGGEEILIGELRIIFHDLDDSPTRPIEVPEETTQRIELPEANFFFEIDESYQTVAPGAHISTRLTITNKGERTERFRVEITGVPRDWVRIDKPELDIPAGKALDVITSFKPLRRSDTQPGDYTVQVAVHALSEPDVVLRGRLNLLVLPYGGFGMAMEKSRLKVGERFRLFIHNQGSAPLPLTLLGRDLNGGLRISIVTPHMTLAPGQRGVVQGEAHPRSPAFIGDPRRHAFDIVIRSEDTSGFVVASRAYVDERPPLPRWSAFVLGGLVLTILTAIVVGLAILLQPAPPQPEIVTFDISDARVAQGDPLALTWSVTNATDLTISLNGTPVLTGIDPVESGVQIDTTPLSAGELLVGLRASNGGRQAEANQRVLIYTPLRANYFQYEPEQVVRYVTQSLTIQWSVPGATATRITGLEGFFTTTPISDSFGAVGEITLEGIPVSNDPINVLLYAQGANDTTLQETLRINIIDPQCTPADGEVTLYAAPDTASQVLATIPADTPVIVNAQDANSQWLRVQLAGGANGWGERGRFTCADTFNIEDLYKELIVPTAAPPDTLEPSPTTGGTGTPTPSASPTQTRTPSRTPAPVTTLAG